MRRGKEIEPYYSALCWDCGHSVTSCPRPRPCLPRLPCVNSTCWKTVSRCRSSSFLEALARHFIITRKVINTGGERQFYINKKCKALKIHMATIQKCKERSYLNPKSQYLSTADSSLLQRSLDIFIEWRPFMWWPKALPCKYTASPDSSKDER